MNNKTCSHDTKHVHNELIRHWLNYWNTWFSLNNYRNHQSLEPWKSYNAKRFESLKVAFVALLNGDAGAIERFGREDDLVRSQVRESECLKRKALGLSTDEIIPMIGCMPGESYLTLKDLRAPVALCQECRNLFLKEKKHRKFCSPECGTKAGQPDDSTERRRDYRRVWTQFQRLLDKESDIESVRRIIRNKEPYAGLIRKWNIRIDGMGSSLDL